MQIEVIGCEEKRKVNRVGDTLVPSRTIRYFLQLRFPDGAIETVRTSKAAIDKYIASH